MNDSSGFHYTPQFDRVLKLIDQGVDLEHVRLVYNAAADELVVSLFAETRHTVAIETGDNLYLLVDPTTEQVLGIQVDNFMSEVVIKRPQLLSFASLAGVDHELLDQARHRIGEDRSRQAALQSALRDLLADSPVPHT